MTLNVQSASAALKEYYTNQRVQDLSYEDCPLYAMLPKHKDFFGKSYPLPMRTTKPQGRSATFTNAQNQKKPSKYDTFSLTRARDYSLASIDTEAMLASETNPGAFVKLAVNEIDGALDSLKRSIAFSLYGNGSGAIGQASAEPAETANFQVTLSNVESVTRFEVGQTLEIWSAESGGTQRTCDGSTNKFVVAGVNRDTGLITFEETYDASGTIAASDYIFVSGDRGNKIVGLDGWCPTSAPTLGDNFFGVDRSVDATRLGGLRINSQGKPQDEALIDAARRLGREGARPDYCFMSYDRYAKLEKTLGAKIRYADVEVGRITFRGIEIPGPKGKIVVLPDLDCPADRAYMLTMKTWGLYSLKEPIMILDMDSNKMLREATADAYEVRTGFYGQVGCDMPGHNGVLIF